ncbi:hypothetical protein ABEB22_06825 [Thioclava sp. 'Guangxiensis']|uniref:hypothetical protein n=1 Tax=Thioclava sp. 'Guangxiensis' TaxID=3149044 RepID=UPI00387842B1
MDQHLTLYLDPPALARLNAGQHNFFQRVIGAVESVGWTVSVEESTLNARLEAPEKKGYALYHMEEPTHDRALTCRRSYTGAYWHVEAQAARWEWPVAHKKFPARKIDTQAAKTFYRALREKVLGKDKVTDEGFALMPLQGRLSEHRSFQSMSPMEMIETVMVRVTQPVIATLHPNEDYTPAERQMLVALANRYPHFSVQEGGTPELLRRCSYVITQNSSVAFEGYILRKPALLFAQVDFHHIAGSVPHMGLDAALEMLAKRQNFAKYLTWFLRDQALNAARPEFEARLLAHLHAKGWPVPEADIDIPTPIAS